MKELFGREEKVIADAEERLQSGPFSSEEEQKAYGVIVKEYKRLLKQTVRLMKMSDLMQSELRTLSEKLEITSQTDVLTGLWNKRYFNEIYQREWLSAVRMNKSIALLMLDIDYFKRYNDTYGHLQGDECLKQVAARIGEGVRRPRDVVARFGGEEFVVLLPETSEEGALMIAEEMRKNIQGLDLEHQASDLGKVVTVSVGVAVGFPEKKCKMDSLLKYVDDALYQAKGKGRNRCEVFAGVSLA